MTAIRTLLSATVAFLLSGCIIAIDPGTYWNERIGESDTFPRRVAGFMRVRFMLYPWEALGISTGYNYFGLDAQVVSTFFIFPRKLNHPEFARQFEAEKNAIEKHNPGAHLLREEQVELTKHGIVFAATKAIYEYEGEFNGGRKRLYSELWLWTHNESYVKLRSTAPFDQQVHATAKTVELLNGVDWAPDRRTPNPKRQQPLEKVANR